MTRKAALIALLFGVAAAAPGAARAQDIRCPRLAQQMRLVDNAGRGDPARAAQYRDAIDRQSAEIRRTEDYAAAVGCAPGMGGQCAALDQNVRRMARNLGALQAQFQRVSANAGVQRDGERERIAAAMAALRCNEPAGTGRPIEAQSARPRGLFEQLFGMGEEEAAPPDLEPDYAPPPSTRPRQAAIQPAPPPDEDALRGPQGSTMRTICVRKCDGYYFPVSFSTSSSRFPQDEAACRARCPAAETGLYAYDTFSQQPEDAVATDTGEPLTALPNAFKYRASFDRACTCGVAQPGADRSEGSPEAALDELDALPGKASPGTVPPPKPSADTPSRAPVAAAPARPEAKTGPAADSLPLTEGHTVETVTADGTRKRVRVIGPAPLPE